MRRPPWRHPLRWLLERDPDFVALRRAARATIIMPALFAISLKVLGNPEVAAFAGFGSFAMLLLADFAGPMGERAQAQAALLVTGGLFICLGTLASGITWLAVIAMAVVGFAVLFAGVISSALARASTALLLAFILPVSLPGPASAIQDRLLGWGMAGAVALVAVLVAWPAPARDPLRGPAAAAIRALAAQLRADAACAAGGRTGPLVATREASMSAADTAVGALRRAFLATPNRPTGLSTPARTVVRLVDAITWLNTLAIHPRPRDLARPPSEAALAVRAAAASTLERGADLLGQPGGDSGPLRAAAADLDEALTQLEEHATSRLPVKLAAVPDTVAGNHQAAASEPGVAEAASDRAALEFLTSLEPSFRAQELTFAVSLIARDIDLTAAAERRGLVDRLLGRQPAGLPGTLSAGRERAASHIERHSVWLHNSLRGAAALGLAVLAAQLTGVQHAFWVVLGALSVLRSNALSTGQDAIRAVLGTTAGFVIGAALLVAVGGDTTLLWVLLPVAVFVAGIAPATISFAGGQAAFTLTLVILFNLLAPTGWQVGLYRVEDVALGALVSLVVGLLFWPRGAGAGLREAIAEAYTDSAAYLTSAVRFGLARCDPAVPAPAPPDGEALRAAAAARRLDDAFRTYLAERGAKPIPLSDVTRLVTGVAGLRLGASAVLALWRCDEVTAHGDRAAARPEIIGTAERLEAWFTGFARDLTSGREPADPLPPDDGAGARLVAAVRQEFGSGDAVATATAVRTIWTADHLDAARRLQDVIIGPARKAVRNRPRGPLGG